MPITTDEGKLCGGELWCNISLTDLVYKCAVMNAFVCLACFLMISDFFEIIGARLPNIATRLNEPMIPVFCRNF